MLGAAFLLVLQPELGLGWGDGACGGRLSLKLWVHQQCPFRTTDHQGTPRRLWWVEPLGAPLGVETLTVSKSLVPAGVLRNALQIPPLRCVSVGAKVRAEIYEAFENIYPILKGFRKTT